MSGDSVVRAMSSKLRVLSEQAAATDVSCSGFHRTDSADALRRLRAKDEERLQGQVETMRMSRSCTHELLRKGQETAASKP
jgi:hypothetical protein